MRSSRTDAVTIRLEVQVPTAGSSPTARLRSARAFKPKPFFVSTSIPAGKPVPVRPGATLGTICASVTYESVDDVGLPDQVKAVVFPEFLFPSDMDDNPVSGAVLGTPNNAGTVFSWTAANELPGADYSASGAPDRLAVWRSDFGFWTFDGSVSFLGVTGTTGPCGNGSGSGPGFVPMRGQTYPAMWCAVTGGFREEPLAVFNSLWALRQEPKAPRPTWTNRGDGKHAPRVELVLDPPREWGLTFSYQQLHIAYGLPFRADPFGPLQFPSRQAELPKLGSVTLPAVEVHAM
jgi:hypothetical protein